jgi:hypothetical protein
MSVEFFANDQLDELFYIFIYYTSLNVSSITVLIIRRSNCINTSSDVLVQFDVLMMGTVVLETFREM